MKYVASHEWLRLEADGSVTVGITHHAQELLGDIVFVELPEVGAELAAEDQAGVVESVKAASDVYAPIAGTVLEANQALVDTPRNRQQRPLRRRWFFKIKPANSADLDGLMSAEQYAAEMS